MQEHNSLVPSLTSTDKFDINCDGKIVFKDVKIDQNESIPVSKTAGKAAAEVAD